MYQKQHHVDSFWPFCSLATKHYIGRGSDLPIVGGPNLIVKIENRWNVV